LNPEWVPVSYIKIVDYYKYSGNSSNFQTKHVVAFTKMPPLCG